MSVTASQITGVAIVCSTVCSGAYQRNYRSSASLVFVRGIHRLPGPVARKIFPFDVGIMIFVKAEFGNQSAWFTCRCAILTHRGRVTHICVSKLSIIGSDNGLSPSRHQAIIWTNAGISLIRLSGTNFSEILIKIDAFSFKKMHLKMSSGKWRPFCLGLIVLNRSLISRVMTVYW